MWATFGMYLQAFGQIPPESALVRLNPAWSLKFHIEICGKRDTQSRKEHVTLVYPRRLQLPTKPDKVGR